MENQHSNHESFNAILIETKKALKDPMFLKKENADLFLEHIHHAVWRVEQLFNQQHEKDDE